MEGLGCWPATGDLVWDSGWAQAPTAMHLSPHSGAFSSPTRPPASPPPHPPGHGRSARPGVPFQWRLGPHTWTKGGHPSSGYDGGSVRPTEESWPLPPGPPFSPSPAEASLTCGALLTLERLFPTRGGASQYANQPRVSHPHPPALITQGRVLDYGSPTTNLLTLPCPFLPMETTRKAPAHVSWPVARHWCCPVGPCWPCLLFPGLHEDKNFCLRDSHSHICVFTVSD